MTKRFLGITLFVAICFPGLAPAQSPLEYSTSLLLRDDSAPRADFSAQTASGYVKYRSIYPKSGPMPLLVYITLKSPALTACMDYRDFQFSLRSLSGREIPLASKIPSGEGMPGIVIVEMSHTPTTPGPYAGCPYRPRGGDRFAFWIDGLYPNLQRGTYTLQITYRPRDGSVPATPLAPITFAIH
jgi:hypothetical protein